MLKEYSRSMENLIAYLKIIKEIPSEKEWNRYAKIENVLSSKTLGYYNETTFNKLCKKLIKNKYKINIGKR